MNLLLDTHILIRLAQEKSLSQKRDSLLRNADVIYYSQFSLWEIYKLYEKNKFDWSFSLADLLTLIERHPLLHAVTLSKDVLIKTAEIAVQMHRDPADQVIVASALISNSQLMTDDQKIKDSRLVTTV
jgi:PIN domain nuclease of toxin-antitoxin system